MQGLENPLFEVVINCLGVDYLIFEPTSDTPRMQIIDDNITERLESFLVLLSSTSPEVIVQAGREETTVVIVDRTG